MSNETRTDAWKAAGLHPSHLCWHAHGWECAPEDSVVCALTHTRAQARSGLAPREYDWTEVGVWKRYIRPLDRQERYEWWVESRDGGWDEHPDRVPNDWDADRYDEDMPVWEFCRRDHPEAWPVWVVGLSSEGAPRDPHARPKEVSGER